MFSMAIVNSALTAKYKYIYSAMTAKVQTYVVYLKCFFYVLCEKPSHRNVSV